MAPYAALISTGSREGGIFATTRWTVIQRAGDAVSPEADRAREHLCRLYWPALYTWLRRDGHAAADAEDLVQGFFARFLARNDFAAADRERGRFRTYLLSGLRHYLISEWRRGDAAKRGANPAHVPLEQLQSEELACVGLQPDLTAQQAFDRRWLSALLAEAMRRLEADYLAAGLGDRLGLLKPWLVADPPDGTYDALAEKLRAARPTVATWVRRLRARFRDAVQDQILETVSNEAEFKEELRELSRLL